MLNDSLDLQTWQNQFCNSIQKNEPSEFTKQARFSIYKNNVFHSLIEALKAQFPVCEKLVGSDFFKGCAQQYLNITLPKRADMILIGEDFSEFLQNFEHTQTLPFLAEVAKLEYTRAQSLQSQSADCINMQDLENIDIQVLQQQHLSFHPSVFILESNFKIFTIWKGHQPGQGMQETNINETEHTLIFRDNHNVACILLSPSIYTCFKAWQNGLNLIEGIQHTLQHFPEFDPTEVIEFIFSNPLITQVR
ncbi:putative DNA-binding domain-containing protein [Marinicellulosiphila megalodicopiae]|uniref:HvfC/BufC family peptide modification chaperone n=1 Tax=Marinicellulosiphila megalodicopiae TaxID=2724896 RepID=UPI003BAE9795